MSTAVIVVVVSTIGALGVAAVNGYFALRANRQKSTVTESVSVVKASGSDVAEALKAVKDLLRALRAKDRIIERRDQTIAQLREELAAARSGDGGER